MINLINCSIAQNGVSNLFARINLFSFHRARKRPRSEYLISRGIHFASDLYNTSSGDLNNNPIRSGVDGRCASQVYVSPPCLLVGTKQICEIAFPRARGMRSPRCTGRNRNRIRTRQFVQRAAIMVVDKRDSLAVPTSRLVAQKRAFGAIILQACGNSRSFGECNVFLRSHAYTMRIREIHGTCKVRDTNRYLF